MIRLAEVPEFAGNIPIEHMDRDYIHMVLDGLDTETPGTLSVRDALSMHDVTAKLAISDDIESMLRMHPAVSILLDRDLFMPDKNPELITTVDKVRKILASDQRVRDAISVYEKDGSDLPIKEHRLLFTLWSVFFESYAHLASRRKSVA